MLTIAIAQRNFTIGDFDANTAAVLDQMRRASDGGAQMVVFSELTLSAYYPGDLFEDAAFLRNMDAALQTVLQASKRWPALVKAECTTSLTTCSGSAVESTSIAF